MAFDPLDDAATATLSPEPDEANLTTRPMTTESTFRYFTNSYKALWRFPADEERAEYFMGNSWVKSDWTPKEILADPKGFVECDATGAVFTETTATGTAIAEGEDGSPYDYLHWQRLTCVTFGGQVVEVMAATSEEGIGVIARWKLEDGRWTVEAMDTESQEMREITDFHEGECVPPEPPAYLLEMPDTKTLDILAALDHADKLLDDIDTAGDMFKPEIGPYFKYVARKCREGMTERRKLLGKEDPEFTRADAPPLARNLCGPPASMPPPVDPRIIIERIRKNEHPEPGAGGAGDVCPDCKGLGGYPRCGTCLNQPPAAPGLTPREITPADGRWENFPYNYMRWHRLLEARIGGDLVELLAASNCDGIPVIARWQRVESKWEVEAMDGESQEWAPIEDNEEEECVPPFPPPIWSDGIELELAEARAEVERVKKQSADRLIGLCKCGIEREQAEQSAAGLRKALEAQEEAERARDRWKSHPMPDSEAPSAVWDTHYAEKDALEDEWTRLETTARDLRAAALAGASGDGKEGLEIFGMKVRVDPSLPPNTMRIEQPPAGRAGA